MLASQKAVARFQGRRFLTTGKATTTGTARLAGRFPTLSYHTNPNTGFQISSVGFGSYRLNRENKVGQETLRQALTSGINLLDTSANYGDGGSELMIGDTIQELIQEEKIQRDEVVVITKAGYVQGRLLERAKELQDNGTPYRDLEPLFEGDSIFHCMSPDFLEDQITQSLERLKMDTIDIYMLHNPEHFFDVYQKSETYDREFYARINRAFEHLEKEVKRGRIQQYGVSCNALPFPRADPTSVSLDFLLHIAKELSPTNHFVAVEFPMNLVENTPYTLKNNVNDTVTLLELAKRAGLLTIANRPLNALINKKVLFRLASPFPHQLPAGHEEIPNELKNALNAAIHHEKLYPGTDPSHPLLVDGHLPPADLLSWAQIVAYHAEHMDLYTFVNFREFQLRPQLKEALNKLDNIEGMLEWSLEYQHRLSQALDLFEQLLRINRRQEIEQFERRLVTAHPALRNKVTLPQKSMEVLLMSGVDCVLSGAHRPEYMADALQLLESHKAQAVDELALSNLFDFVDDQAKFIYSKTHEAAENRAQQF